MTVSYFKYIFLLSLFISLTLHAQSVEKTYLLGKFDPATHPQFSKLDDAHTSGSARGKYLRNGNLRSVCKNERSG
ncbi:MAG: hypothetical protein IPJ20_24300 [Flammeovirgaceae bacterium]|nr:hypothetical protein [Flammeovirgaceae bacterium]